MLNACRHQRNNHHDAELLRFRFSRVLNACRHQRNNHRGDVNNIKHLASDWCSTPVGIKGTITPNPIFVGPFGLSVLNACRHQRNNHIEALQMRIQKGRVLNACRHQRNNHREDEALMCRAVVCSTPVGIKGTITRPCCAYATEATRAQRLSASKEQSPPPLCPSARQRSCSTPVGIKGTITCALPQPLDGTDVLNACRHQRNNHSPARPRRDAQNRCSTPVGIKGTITLQVEIQRKNHSHVLNACRHQRNNHRTCSHLSNARHLPVLNACRHQRNNHIPALTRNSSCAG